MFSTGSQAGYRVGEVVFGQNNTSRYPTATFTLTRPVTVAPPSVSATVTATATGNMTLHGSTRAVTFTISARRTGEQLQALGAIPTVFAH